MIVVWVRYMMVVGEVVWDCFLVFLELYGFEEYLVWEGIIGEYW